MDLGDPSYHSNPVAPMCAKTHEFLRLIRVLIRDMVDSLGMSNDSGFVTIGDLVQILVAWGSEANEEQVLELLTKVGSQFLDVIYDDTTILIKDKSHESVPSIAAFKRAPSHFRPEALPQATVAATPRTRSAVIQHVLRWVISTGILATSTNGAVEFNKYIDALSALEELPPNPWRDFEIANADPSLKLETIGGKTWLSHIDISQIQLVTEEWFRSPPDPKTESISPVITMSLANAPQESVSAIPSSPTKESSTSEKSPRSPSDNPLTLARARIAQTHIEESGVSPNLPAATVPVLAECPTPAQGKVTSVTSGPSSPPATRAEVSVPAADEGHCSTASDGTGGESSLSLALFPPIPPAGVTTPSPVPKQPPQLSKQANRVKNKGGRPSAMP